MTTTEDRNDAQPHADAGGPDAARRSLVRGGVVLGAVVVGAGLSRIGAGTVDAKPSVAEQDPTPAAAAEKPAAGGAAPAASGPKKLLGPADKVPVGGGVIYEKANVVVTQPTAGEYKAFSGTCTHQKCTLADVSDGTINCACHGAKFSIVDGSAKKIPARTPLAPKTVTVEGGKLYTT